MRRMNDMTGPAQLCLTLIAADSSRLMERDDYVDALANHIPSPVDTNHPNDGPTQSSNSAFPGEARNQRLVERKETGLILPADVWSELDTLLTTG